MELVIKIRCDNAAFEGDVSYEVARILRCYVDRIMISGELERPLMDVNGNRVGQAEVTK